MKSVIPQRFFKLDSDEPAEVLLRQITPNQFRLEEPFRYLDPPRYAFAVPSGDKTDLASVPTFLVWLVPRYGRHSLPALLHDHLQDPAAGVSSEEADTIFRSAMASTDVPFVRRWLMWAGVSLRTRWHTSIAWKIVVLLWVAVYGIAVGIGQTAAVVQIINRHSWFWPTALVYAIALVSPWLLCLLWGKRRRAGLIAAYGLVFIGTPLVFIAITLGWYALFEFVARMLGRRTAPLSNAKLETKPPE